MNQQLAAVLPHLHPYLLTGWSIVPATIEDKRSLVAWKQWQTIAPTPEQVARWDRRWPRANWAIITGPLSDVVVIDIDVCHGGDRAVAELEQAHGDLPWLAVVETPSGGWHVYLRHPGDRIPNSESKIGLGIDVRGDSGLALLPPSRRSAGQYRWALGGPTTIPPMPPAWIKLLRPVPRQVIGGTRRGSGAAFPANPSRKKTGSTESWQPSGKPRTTSATGSTTGPPAGSPRCSRTAPQTTGKTPSTAPASRSASTQANAAAALPPAWARSHERQPQQPRSTPRN